MTYVISDLHGYPLEKIQQLFKKAGFSKNDTCYVLGDVIDRGNDSIKILRYLMQQPNMHLLLGNHEAMLLDSAELIETDLPKEEKPSFSCIYNFNVWMYNGGDKTYNDLNASPSKVASAIVDYIRQAPLYKEINVNGHDFILSHGGLGNFHSKKSLREYTKKELIWNRPYINDQYYQNKTVIFGHTPTVFYGDQYAGKILRTETWIDIDAGVACGYPPALLRLDDMMEFYLD